MATIDKLDISVYNLYAVRTKMLEQINQQYRLDQASSIPPQTQVLDIYPKLSELDLLLGVARTHAPWAFFYPPVRFALLRKSPFSFSRIVPSIGSDEEEEEAKEKLQQVEVESEEEEEEKQILQACFKELHKINDWLGFIIGRVGQFLQG